LFKPNLETSEGTLNHDGGPNENIEVVNQVLIEFGWSPFYNLVLKCEGGFGYRFL